MGSLVRLFSQYWQVSLAFFLLIVLYLWHTLTNTPRQQVLDKYDITVGQLKIILLTIAIPYIIIWLIGLVGFLRLHSYTRFLGKSKDGRGFRTLSWGVLLFTLWLPISTIAAGLASRYYENHPNVTEELTWLVNYVNLFVLLPAFYLINRGATLLVKTTKAKWVGMSSRQTVLYIFVAAVYVFVTFHDTARNVAATNASAASYYQPDWVILLTLILPRLYMWYLGLSAAASIVLYSKEVNGRIYKLALRDVAIGIAGVVTATIILRIVQSMASALVELNLTVLLLIIYLLLIVIGTGYVFIAKGTQKLQKIEES